TAGYHYRGRRTDAADAVRGAGGAGGNAAAGAGAGVPFVQGGATVNCRGEGADWKPAYAFCSGGDPVVKGAAAWEEVTAGMRTGQRVSSGLGLLSFHPCAIGAPP